MKWIEKNRKNTTTVWLVLLLIIAVLSIWLCSIIEIISNQITLSSQGVVEELSIYQGALQLWKSVYVGAILSATAILMASGLVTLLIPQSCSLSKKLKLKDTCNPIKQNLSKDDDLLEKPHCV